MNTTALHIVELVKSLPMEDQHAVREALLKQGAARSSLKIPGLVKTETGDYYNPDGIPDDHPFFKILDEEGQARHREAGPPTPDFD